MLSTNCELGLHEVLPSFVSFNPHNHCKRQVLILCHFHRSGHLSACRVASMFHGCAGLRPRSLWPQSHPHLITPAASVFLTLPRRPFPAPPPRTSQLPSEPISAVPLLHITGEIPAPQAPVRPAPPRNSAGLPGGHRGVLRNLSRLRKPFGLLALASDKQDK